MKIILIVSILLSILMVSACDSSNKRDFTLSEDEIALTGADLDAWLRQAPFSNEFQTKSNDSGTFILTNIDEIFPVLGGFKNADDDLYYETHSSGELIADVFERTSVIYEDPEWGNVFLHAAYMFEHEALFLKDYYTTMGNIAFGGASSINKVSRATLNETQLVEESASQNAVYKAIIYDMRADSGRYLKGFYQQGRVVLQFAFPWKDEAQNLEQLRRLNKALGLNVETWNSATVDSLALAEKPTTFWQDPFIDLYLNDVMVPAVSIKTRTTQYVTQKNRIASQAKVDYLLQYEDEKGLYTISFVQTPEPLSRTEFAEQQQSERIIDVVRDDRDIFVTSENVKNGQMYLSAVTYFRQNLKLDITASYPVFVNDLITTDKSGTNVEQSNELSNLEAQQQLEKILSTMRVKSF